MLKINFPKKYLVLLMQLITAQICLGSYDQARRYCLFNDAAINAPLVYKYIEKYPSLVQARNSMQKTVLHVIAQYGTTLTSSTNEDSHTIIGFLLMRGADPNARDWNNNTALHIAAYNNRQKVVLVLKYKMDVNSPGWGQKSPLHMAAQEGHVDIIKCLLTSGTTHADVDPVDAFGHTPLHSAVCRGHLAAMECLLYLGADIEAKDTSQLTPLHNALRYQQVDVFFSLIKKGADTSTIDALGNTIMHCAAMMGYPDIIVYLGEHHISSPEVINNQGQTPLHLAAFHNHYAACHALIELGADVNVGDTSRGTPLHFLCAATRNNPDQRQQDLQCAVLLMRNGAKADSKESANWTPLHYALREKKFRIALLLAETVPQKDDIPADLSSVSDQNEFLRALATFNVIRFLSRRYAYGWCAVNENQPSAHNNLQEEAGREMVRLLDAADTSKVSLPTKLNKTIISFLITPEAFIQLEARSFILRHLNSAFATLGTYSRSIGNVPNDPAEEIVENRRTLAALSSTTVLHQTKFPHDVNVLILSFVYPPYAWQQALSAK